MSQKRWVVESAPLYDKHSWRDLSHDGTEHKSAENARLVAEKEFKDSHYQHLRIRRTDQDDAPILFYDHEDFDDI